MWDPGWDEIFLNNEWGKYPPEELIRFVARNYYSVEDRKKIRFLEVGCGTGANLWYLANEGFSVTGIDGSKVAIERCQRRFEIEGLSARFIQGDVISLALDDDSIDCVVDNECLYANSFKDSQVILKEIFRVIRPGGLLFSKTFMTGTSGDGSGEKIDGELNTYKHVKDGALREGYGIIRFTSRSDIDELYADFEIKSIDYVKRSDHNGRKVVREWVIICQKNV